jgi:hypothetical protein
MPRRGLPLIVAVGLLVVIVGIVVECFTASVWVDAVGGVISLLGAVATRPGTNRRGFGLSLVGLLLAIAAIAAVRLIARM